MPVGARCAVLPLVTIIGIAQALLNPSVVPSSSLLSSVGISSLVTSAPAPTPAGTSGTIEQDQHYLETAYGVLRSSNNAVGKGVQSMLGVQTNLDVLGKDLTAEYETFKWQKSVYLDERNQLANEMARLEKALGDQKSHAAKIANLTRERDALHKQNNDLAVEKDRDHMQRLVGIMKIRDQVKHLEAFAGESQAKKVKKVAKANIATGRVRSKNKVLQKEMFDLNGRMLAGEDQRSRDQVGYQKTHQAMLIHIEDSQRQIGDYQQEIIGQAQLQKELQDYRDKVVTQAAQTLSQRGIVVAKEHDCTAYLQGLDKDIAEAKSALQVADEELAACQRVGEMNKRVQEQLKNCNIIGVR